MKHENMQAEAYEANQYPYIVIARSWDGTYGPVLNAIGVSVWDAVNYARTFAHMADYRKFRVIGRWSDETGLTTITDITMDRRSGGDRRAR